jgi:multimeric flavodoxin WrbA
MRIVGLVGSPRKGRNTDVIVRRVLDGCRDAGAAAGTVHLNDLQIRPGQACRVQDGQGCRFRDGMDGIYEVLQEADGLILGTPVYYNAVSAQMKLMVDRCQCLAMPVPLPDGGVSYQSAVGKKKKGIVVAVGGSGLNPDIVLPTFRIWAPEVNLELVGSLLATRAGLGMEPMDNGVLLEQAYRMGRDLVAAMMG